jgi:hypothetical protein
MLRVYFLVGMAYVGLCLAAIALHAPAAPAPIPVRPHVMAVAPHAAEATSGTAWFQNVRPHCNALEVETQQRRTPAPRDNEGAAYSAACYALGGKIAHAHAVLDSMPEQSRAWAAGIVFNVGHPVADAGDNESAGPIMRLVLDYQPDNYMALYHAGMAEWTLGDHERARTHLIAFRRLYSAKDFFGTSADSALRTMGEE